jgi:hypothetical protein
VTRLILSTVCKQKSHKSVLKFIFVNLYISVPARISKGQGAGPEKGLFSALLDFQKRHFLGTL